MDARGGGGRVRVVRDGDVRGDSSGLMNEFLKLVPVIRYQSIMDKEVQSLFFEK